MRQHKSSTNHITGEKNISINSEDEAVVADKKSSVNFNKTVIGGLSPLMVIVTILINAIAVGTMVYLVDTKINQIEQDLEAFKEDTKKNFIDVSYTVSELYTGDRNGR